MDSAVREGAGTETGTQTETDTLTQKALARRVWVWVNRRYLFMLTVALPTVTATVYYGFIASNVYVSVSRFIVHSPQAATAHAGGLIGEFLQGANSSRSLGASFALEDYVQSRDALHALEKKVAMRQAFNGREIDVFSRFPGLHWNDSFEAFYRYYVKHVGITYDPGTSISTLTVSAYTPEDAYRINDALLGISEQLINNLNGRSREDLVRYAEQDVRAAEKKAANASLALFAYRTKHAVFAPDAQAAIELQTIAKLQAGLITTESELAQLEQLSPSNPQIAGLESRAGSLRSAIAGQSGKVTGGSGSLSARAPEFEKLALESTIADKELGASLAELDSARRDAARQQLYLERLVQPNLPDSAMEPRRLRAIMTAFGVGMILWGVLALVIASIREHLE